jgi:hypothetical protein
MGLDMFLQKKYSKYRKDDGTFSANWDDLKMDDFGRSNRVEFSEMVGYWRKDNHIHRWFLENVQGGEDDCREYYVSIEQLHELRDICFNILKKLDGVEIGVPENLLEDFNKENDKYPDHKMEQIVKIDINNFDSFKKLNGYHILTDSQIELCDCESELPTQSGFFFGSCDYDGWYIRSLVKTIQMFDEIFKEYEENQKLREMKDNNCLFFDYYYQASW